MRAAKLALIFVPLFLASAAAKEPVVKLLAPGNEPRQKLRFKVAKGDKQRVVMQMKMAMTMDLGMGEQSVDMPTMTMGMEVTIDDVKPSGEIAYSFVVKDTSVGDDGMAGVKSALGDVLASMKGMSGKARVTNRGFNLGAEITMPEGANPQLAQMLEQMKDMLNQIAVPVPEEAVGVGARWEVTQMLRQQSMEFKNVTTFELTSLEGNRLNARSSVVQSADPQKVINPSMPSVKMELLRMKGGGSGELTFDLTKAMPLASTVSSTVDFDMQVETGGKTQKTNMKIKMSAKVTGQ